MSSPELLDAVPYWTERMYPPGGGQDHLGLGSVVTDGVLPRLSPGINVLTIHPRYWSFYAFVLSEFWMRDLPRTKAALKAWYRPLECIYSVACSLCDGPDHRGTPIGTRRISSVVAGEPDGFDPQFHYMDSPMGGYGLYYATVMQAVGLVAPADRRLGLTVDAVTPAGQRVAEAFRSVVADTEYYRHWIDRHDESVPCAVAAEYGRRACFCRLREPGASDRPILVDAFLHLGNPGESAARRETLRFMCELAAQSVATPVDESSFRRLIYFGPDRGDEHSKGPTFVPSEPILSTARRWRLYQAREYFNASVNEMWRRLTYWGLQREGDRVPVPMTEVRASLEQIDFTSFASSVGVDLPDAGLSTGSSYQALLDWVMSVGAVSGELDDRWNLDAALSEDKIIEWLDYEGSSTEAGADHLAAALTLITFVAARLWNAELALVEPGDWFPVLEGGRKRLGMQRFLGQLRERVNDGATVGDVAEWLTFDYVISQHERVAMAKLPTTGDTFRFRREAGRSRFFPKVTRVGMNDSRFNALATFLFELGWCGYLYEEDHDLSEEGEAMRLSALLGAYPNGNIEVANLLIGERTAFDHLLNSLLVSPESIDITQLGLSLKTDGDDDDEQGSPSLHAATELSWEAPRLSGVFDREVLVPPQLIVDGAAVTEVAWELSEPSADRTRFAVSLDEEAASALNGVAAVRFIFETGEETWPTFPYHVNALNALASGQARTDLLKRAGDLDLGDAELEELLAQLDAALALIVHENCLSGSGVCFFV